MSTDGSALGYAELLRLATSGGLQELESTIVQIPTDQNGHHAVVLAGARTGKAIFRAVGEAWRDTLPPPLRAQTLTVAEMRAKTRALCEAVGMPQPLAAPDAPARSDQPAPAGGAAAPKPAPAPEQRRVEASQEGASPAPGHGTAAPVAAAAGTPPPVIIRPAPPPAPDDAGEDEAPPSAVAARQRPQTARTATRPAPVPPPAEGLGPDILSRLLQMTRKKAAQEGNEISEEEAMRKLDSFFQRAFGHPLAEGTRMEGQRVVQRLASELARLSAERGEAAFATG